MYCHSIHATEIEAIADQLNNILTVIGGYTVLLGDNIVPGDPYEGDIVAIKASLRSAEAVTRRLALLAEDDYADGAESNNK